jgi:mono/diheme cytochrome c family protein
MRPMRDLSEVARAADGARRKQRVRGSPPVGLRVCAGLFAALTLVHVSAAQQAPATTPAFPDTGYVTNQIIADGRSIFRGHGGCIICHGVNLKGGIGPTLLEHPWKDAKNGTLAEIFRVVTSGVPATSMLARPNGISDDQARRVSAYVWAASHHRSPP